MISINYTTRLELITSWRYNVKDFIVKDLMVPLAEYAAVQKGSTLFEAVLALEKAQEDYDHNKYQHRAIFVLNKDKNVIGKLSQLDILRALESQNENKDKVEAIKYFGFSMNYISSLKTEKRLAESILDSAYEKANALKVEDFMQARSEGECIEEEASLDAAIHQLLMGNHLGLLVVRNHKVIGILRMADIFAAVFHAMKDRELTQ